MQPKDKIIYHDIPLRPWEVLGADVFCFNNKNYLLKIFNILSNTLLAEKGISPGGVQITTASFPLSRGWSDYQQKA